VLSVHVVVWALAFQIDDPRTASDAAYADECLSTGQAFYGADQPADGSSRGALKGTLVLDVSDWDSHMLASLVLAIVAEEVVSHECGWLRRRTS
jgi:hypothetical protein